MIDYCTLYPEEYESAVEWDDFVSGHSCDGTCKEFHGWYTPVGYLELIPEERFDPSVIDDLTNIL